MTKSAAFTAAAIASLAETLGWEALEAEAEVEALAEDVLISWQGALEGGTLVDFIYSDDGKNGGFVLTKDRNTEPTRWLGTLSATPDGKVTITDDTTKDSVTFQLLKITEDAAITIDVEGYGKGAIVPMTAGDWKRVAEAEELAKLYETAVNWVGTFEDGSLVVYMDSPDGSLGALVIAPSGAKETKTWTGKVSNDNGKVTITDDDSKESITITTTKTEEEGGLLIQSDDYGKGVLIRMTVGDWVSINETLKANPTK